MGSVDLRHAYYSINVAQEHRKFLRFAWNNRVNQYTSCPQGLASAPRLFTKLLKPVFATLRRLGHACVGYIDDTLLYGAVIGKRFLPMGHFQLFSNDFEIFNGPFLNMLHRL